MQFQENITTLNYFVRKNIVELFRKKKYCLSISEIIVCNALQTLSDIIY